MIFDPNLLICVYTDANIEGEGAILKQIRPNGEEKRVAYFSKKLRGREERKKTRILEVLQFLNGKMLAILVNQKIV